MKRVLKFMSLWSQDVYFSGPKEGSQIGHETVAKMLPKAVFYTKYWVNYEA